VRRLDSQAGALQSGADAPHLFGVTAADPVTFAGVALRYEKYQFEHLAVWII